MTLTRIRVRLEKRRNAWLVPRHTEFRFCHGIYQLEEQISVAVRWELDPAARSGSDQIGTAGGLLRHTR